MKKFIEVIKNVGFKLVSKVSYLSLLTMKGHGADTIRTTRIPIS